MSWVNFLQTLSEPLKREAAERAASQFVAAEFRSRPHARQLQRLLTGLLVENRRCDS
jgi:hypothetical protein